MYFCNGFQQRRGREGLQRGGERKKRRKKKYKKKKKKVKLLHLTREPNMSSLV